jgi:four helix bundle protein
MSFSSFQGLTVWKKSIELVVRIYEVSEVLPEREKYGIVSQMRRAAVSIPSNIAEGHGRRSDGDFARFLRISLGSCRELQTLLIVSEKLKFLEFDSSTTDACEEIAKMLSSLIQKLKVIPK